MDELVEEILSRNFDFLNSIIKKYRLKIKIDGILDFQNIIIVNVDGLPFAFRVFATFTTREEGKLKQHKQNLYNLLKKKVEFLSDEEIFEEREDFIKFVEYWKQAKYLFQAQLSENKIKNAGWMAKQPVLPIEG